MSRKASDGPATLESDALAWVLGVPASDDFVAQHLGRTWFHARSEERDRFAKLLSLAQLDDVLGTHGGRHPGIGLVRADQNIPVSEYVWRDSMVDPAQVARLFAEGATVMFNALQDRHEGTRQLCTAMTRQVGARSQTNIYLTPPDSQGFKPHWDSHDVYVIQVEGSKRWRIYGGGFERPLQDQKFDSARHTVGDVEAEFTLVAGEVLYIPRGVTHAATTTEEISLHITLGVMPYTWADLVADCLSEIVERMPSWRDNVPFGFGRGDERLADLHEQLGRKLGGLTDEVDLLRVVSERQRSFDASLRPRADDLMRQALGAADVCERDHLRWRTGSTGRLERREGRVAWVGVSREVEFPAAATRTLEHLISGNPIRAGEVDDGLDWESRRVVLATLIREGLVARASVP